MTVSLRPRGLRDRCCWYGGEEFGKASSGLRWREDVAREYNWSDWIELVREECEVDGGSKGGIGGARNGREVEMRGGGVFDALWGRKRGHFHMFFR